MTLPEVLRDLRAASGLSLNATAAACGDFGLQISGPAVSQYEHGRRTPNNDTLATLLDVWGASPAQRATAWAAANIPNHDLLYGASEPSTDSA